MKYYCKNCKAEIIEGTFPLKDTGMGKSYECPVCGNFTSTVKIPDYETPEQYEKRTGKKITWHTAVWYRYIFEYDRCPWRLDEFMCVEGKFRTEPRIQIEIVVADPPVPPPDDWKPKEEYETDCL